LVPSAGASAAEYHARGRKLLQEDHFQEAIEQLTEALKLNPSFALAYNARGYAHFRLKQYPQALADFDEAIRLTPSYLNAYVNRGAARRAAGDKAGADADQAKARELMQGRK
jgi:tetratricopeptide (TPR) repeat protein